MQLQGPVLLNQYEVGFASQSQPCLVSWQDERESSGRIQTNRAGTETLIGPPRLRGTVTVGFDGLDKQEATRLLFELKGGLIDIVPRTDIGGGGFVDLDGDGVPDLILDEVTLPCRITSDVPSTLPLGRTDNQGNIYYNIQLELKTREVYDEIPGFTQPVVTQFRHFHTQGGPDYNLRIGGMQGLVDMGDGQGFTEVSGTINRTIDASDGEQLATLVFTSKTLQGFSMRTRAVTGNRGDSNGAHIYFSDDQDPTFGTDFSGLTVEGNVNFDSNSGQRSVFGELTAERSFDSVSGLWNRGHLRTPPTAIKGSAAVENGEGWLTPSDVMLLPSNMASLRMTGSGNFNDNNIVSAGGPIGPNTTLISAQFSTNFDINVDDMGSEQVGAAPTPARNVVEFEVRNLGAGEHVRMFKAMRKVETFRNRFGAFSSEDFRGLDVIPDSLITFRFDSCDFNGETRMPDDWSFLQAQNCTLWRIDSAPFSNNKPAITTVDGVQTWNWKAVIDGFYSQRQFLDGDETISINRVDEVFRRVYFSGWKTIADMHKTFGLADYHPDGTQVDPGLIDYVHGINIPTAFESPVATIDPANNEIRLDRTIDLAGTNGTDENGDPYPDYDLDGDKGGFKLRYQSGFDEIQAYVFDNGPSSGGVRRWMPIFQIAQDADGVEDYDNRLIRLRGPSSDVQYQIADATYDDVNGEIVLTIDDTASRDGVSTDISRAEVGADALYAFFFYNLL